MNSACTESVVEGPAPAWLGALAYAMLDRRLRQALLRLHPNVQHEALENPPSDGGGGTLIKKFGACETHRSAA
jgi:hypothetical protein